MLLTNLSFLNFCFYQNSENEPDRKSDPCCFRQLHHQVDVDENAEDREDGNERDLEAQPLLRRRLPREQDEAEDQEAEDDDDECELESVRRHQDHHHGQEGAEDGRAQGEEGGDA